MAKLQNTLAIALSACLATAALLAPNSANACLDASYYKSKEIHKKVCDLEKSLPFKPRKTSIKNDYIVFLEKEKFDAKGNKTHFGMLFGPTGEPFSSDKDAQRMAKKAARLRGCDLTSVVPSKSGPTEIHLTC